MNYDTAGLSHLATSEAISALAQVNEPRLNRASQYMPSVLDAGERALLHACCVYFPVNVV